MHIYSLMFVRAEWIACQGITGMRESTRPRAAADGVVLASSAFSLEHLGPVKRLK
jgi:hypothetical protein